MIDSSDIAVRSGGRPKKWMFADSTLISGPPHAHGPIGLVHRLVVPEERIASMPVAASIDIRPR